MSKHPKNDNICYTGEENLHIFQMNIFISMKFYEKMCLMIIIKVIQLQGFSLSLANPLPLHPTQPFKGEISRRYAYCLFIRKKILTQAKENYWLVSVFPVLSNVFERLMRKKIRNYWSEFLWLQTKFQYKTCLNQIDSRSRGYSGAVLIDISKAFDRINHELLITKLHAFGFNKDYLTGCSTRFCFRATFIQYALKCFVCFNRIHWCVQFCRWYYLFRMW